MAEGRVADKPFVIVAQQSLFDDRRAPPGQHTGWAYCHVPNGSSLDCTDRIEAQVERLAPGFRRRILARHAMTPAWIESHNLSMAGGDIGGGANDLTQLFMRPVWRMNPYTTPNPRLFLCSSSTPPGAGVHGMCGFGAAQAWVSALKGTLRFEMLTAASDRPAANGCFSRSLVQLLRNGVAAVPSGM